MAVGTCHSYARGVERYLGWCDEMNRVWAERESVEVWRQSMREKGYSASSVNTWSAGVKTFFAWAMAEGELRSDPARGLPSLKPSVTSRPRTTPMTDREVLSVLNEPDSSEIGVRDRAILMLMAYAAARVIDIQRACLGGLVQLDGQWQLAFADGQESIHVTHQEAVDALEDWLAVHPLAESPEAALFVALGNRARDSD
jgi:site-specific recombinase XerC